MAKIKAAVIFGGTAQEHELSLASAAEVIRNIPADKYDVTCIGITKKGRWLFFPGDVEEIADGSWEMNPDNASAILSPDPLHRGIIVLEDGDATVRRIDVVFPVLQGKRGADGTIQALLDMSGIPYVGSGHLAAASCMDKSHTHMMLDDYGIPTADWKLITQRDINCIDKRCEEIAASLGFPVVVKPANSGCSAGTTLARDMDELNAAVKVAFSNDNKVLAERYVKARRIEVAVFGYDSPFASNVGEITSVGRNYDPTEVRKSSGDDFAIPADLPAELAAQIRDTAVRTFKALGCKGLARVDFLLDESGSLLLNKVVTSPGLRQNSVFPRLMKEFGIDMPELVDMLLEQALENSERAY
ncbi:MAG: D-alanine--D-alanine ligase [Ruminococcus sp.]|nr:D-alanine--D-alanine ligase [Ruminococcus sp.]MCR5016915.1 D-alanine--D-alanine ligase [Ruminococcus sp.]